MESVFEKGLPQAFIDIITDLKTSDDSRSSNERVGIGGEIHFVAMDKSESVLYVCHRFDDYDKVFEEMLQNLETT